MNRLQILVAALAVIIMLLAACAPQVSPSPAAPQVPAPQAATAARPVAVPSTAVTTARPAWQVEWEKVVEAAKREGRVSLATSGGTAFRSALVESFKSAYGIPVEAISGKGSQLNTKILAERRAGLYLQDVYLGGSSPINNELKPASALDPLPPLLILPDVTDPELIKKTWYTGGFHWIDKDRTMLAIALYPNYPIAINTNLVKEGDIKFYRDLLHPRWYGKLILNDPTVVGVGESLLAFADNVLGWDFIVDLAKTKPMVVTDSRLMTEWLAHGKAALLVPPKTDTLTDFINAGAPLRGLVPEEGTWLTGGSADLAVLNKPAHPNATKVFVNWLLSKEGSTVVSKVAGYHMARLDVPTDHLPADQIRDPKVKYFIKEDEKVLQNQPVLSKKAKDLLAPLMGK